MRSALLRTGDGTKSCRRYLEPDMFRRKPAAVYTASDPYADHGAAAGKQILAQAVAIDSRAPPKEGSSAGAHSAVSEIVERLEAAAAFENTSIAFLELANVHEQRAQRIPRTSAARVEALTQGARAATTALGKFLERPARCVNMNLGGHADNMQLADAVKKVKRLIDAIAALESDVAAQAAAPDAAAPLMAAALEAKQRADDASDSSASYDVLLRGTRDAVAALGMFLDEPGSRPMSSSELSRPRGRSDALRLVGKLAGALTSVSIPTRLPR